MRLEATKSNTIGETSVLIACHVPATKERETETAFKEQLAGVTYRLDRIMGLNPEHYDEFNLISTYEVSLSSGKLESGVDLRPGYTTHSVKVRTFAGDHKSIESLLTEHRKQCDENIPALGAMLAGLGLSPQAVVEHLQFYRDHVRGA